jgi:hypothetical protein
MDTCPRCGAARSADLTWCGQCFLRFDDDGGARGDSTVLMSFGEKRTGLPIWARVLVTAAVIGGGCVLIAAFEPWWDHGGGMWILGAVLLIVYASVGGLLVARFWAPETFTAREEHVVFLDQRAIDDVEARQRSLATRPEPDAPGR